MNAALKLFHPGIARWFEANVGAPTAVQSEAWPLIAAGHHVLATAPTGSGKTLAAFFWALNQLGTGAWPSGAVRVLYVSPLKALNNDIQRNLLAPLAGLHAHFADAGAAWQPVHVQTRSGDTPQSERRRMLRQPPEILITTPESLHIMLTSQQGATLFTGLRTVILDELHAVADGKRGAQLMTGVERLVLHSDQFQRIALSATVRPLERMAAFAGGYELDVDGDDPVYRPRKVHVVRAAMQKEITLAIRHTPKAPVTERAESRWPAVTEAVRDIVAANTSTLVFTNSRRTSERLALLVNDGQAERLAYAHHGSLSREMRLLVEERLKKGELRAIVSTSSLELGIDIGALDQVVLLQTPPSVASALQRLGRAGHQVGAASHGTLLPLHTRDYLDAAVMALAVDERDIEPLKPVQAPLDVLAQTIVSMAAAEPWDIDALYAFLRCAWPFHTLTREAYDRVIDMLAGRYDEARLRELRPALHVDRVDNTITGDNRARRMIYSSGGTIPDRGYYALRRLDTGAKIGELDEEFVWERHVGDRFPFGTQTWRVEQITHNDVLVSPVGAANDLPFWRADNRGRSHHLSMRLADFLEAADGQLNGVELHDLLVTRCRMAPGAAEETVAYLRKQREATRTPLPHRHHLLVEYVRDATFGGGNAQILLHTLWGAMLNRPYALALAQAWEERFGGRLEVYPGDDCIALITPDRITATELLGLVTPENLYPLLRKRLEQSGFFGARFREAAGIALQLPRPGFDRRMPLWLTRIRAKRLLDAVAQLEDFPVVAEAWRACLQDEFDLEALTMHLTEIAEGGIHVSTAHTDRPSPIAEAMSWRQTNLYMYLDDTPEGNVRSRLSDTLLREIALNARLRPRIDRALVDRFEAKVQRVAPGYAPASPEELLDTVKERLFLAESAWQALHDAAVRDHGKAARDWPDQLARKLAWVSMGERRHLVAVENLPRMARVFQGVGQEFDAVPYMGEGRLPRKKSPAESPDADAIAGWLAEGLRFFGPLTREVVREHVPLPANALDRALATLLDDETLVEDLLTDGAADPEVCDAENLQALLRMARAAARPVFEALPVEHLSPFLAAYQGVVQRGEGAAGLQDALEALFAWPGKALLFETEILPARVKGYRADLLDSVIAQTGLGWFGTGKECIAFGFAEHTDLRSPTGKNADAVALLPDARGRYPFSDLLDQSNQRSDALTAALWTQAWKGWLTNDAFAALRMGIETKFKPVPMQPGASRTPMGARGRHHAFKRWRATRPFSGNWYLLQPPEAPRDALDADEQARDRVRLLLDRYGVLFRELLLGEFPALRWGALFRALRLMELAGEVLSGQFFEGIPGLQFCAPDAFRMLRDGIDPSSVYWLHAHDPASLCGVPLNAIKGNLPRRHASTHLVYHGERLVLVSQRHGKDLDIRVTPAEADSRYFDVFRHLLTRDVHPLSYISLETINDEKARRSPWLDVFRQLFEVNVGVKDVGLLGIRRV